MSTARLPNDDRAAADLRGADWLDANGRPHCIWDATAPKQLKHNATTDVPKMNAANAWPLTEQCDVQWHNRTCCSPRQKQEMGPGGALGRWSLRGDPAVCVASRCGSGHGSGSSRTWARMQQWSRVQTRWKEAPHEQPTRPDFAA